MCCVHVKLEYQCYWIYIVIVKAHGSINLSIPELFPSIYRMNSLRTRACVTIFTSAVIARPLPVKHGWQSPYLPGSISVLWSLSTEACKESQAIYCVCCMPLCTYTLLGMVARTFAMHVYTCIWTSIIGNALLFIFEVYGNGPNYKSTCVINILIHVQWYTLWYYWRFVFNTAIPYLFLLRTWLYFKHQ